MRLRNEINVTIFSGADPNIISANNDSMLAWATENDDFYELLWDYGARGFGADCEVPETASGCSTVGGDVVGADCVFPFDYQGSLLHSHWSRSNEARLSLVESVAPPVSLMP